MVTVCPSQFATRRTLFHALVGCALLMLKLSRLKLPVIWLLVSMCLNTLTKSQIFFFNDTATTEIYTLSLHDALPICHVEHLQRPCKLQQHHAIKDEKSNGDRKSTRLNSSHQIISYAVFCLKKKKLS